MKTLFLDRDGVINRNPPNKGYVRRWEEFHFIPNARRAIRDLTAAGYRIIVITNQSGIGRGLYTEETLGDIHARMLTEISTAGGRIAGVYYCPHRPDDGCECRKPKTGMIRRAVQEHNLQFTNGYLIGDTTTDIQAGHRAGLTPFLVLTGLGQESYDEYINPKGDADDQRPAKIFTNLYTATQWLLKNDT